MKKKTIVLNIGVNDYHGRVSKNKKVFGKTVSIWRCPIYAVWRGMLERCYGEKCQIKQPTYIGCSVADEWLSFSRFRAWIVSKDYVGKELDKDILVTGNKIYSPEFCVLVSKQLNRFMTDSRAARGRYLIGVDWHKASSRFRASCRNPFTDKQETIGYYTDESEAHEAWRARKHEHACSYADMQTDPRIAQALRERYAKQVNPEAEIA